MLAKVTDALAKIFIASAATWWKVAGLVIVGLPACSTAWTRAA